MKVTTPNNAISAQILTSCPLERAGGTRPALAWNNSMFQPSSLPELLHTTNQPRQQWAKTVNAKEMRCDGAFQTTGSRMRHFTQLR